MAYNNGSKYTGYWKKNQKEGKGTFYDVSGKVVEGTWVNGNLAGSSSGDIASNEPPAAPPSRPVSSTKPSTNTSSNASADCNKLFCDGGKLGTYMYGDGSKYVGTHRKGKPEGEGTLYYLSLYVI